MPNTNRMTYLTGLSVLFLGVLVYLIDRDPSRIYFLYIIGLNKTFYGSFPNFFGPFGSSLPSFIHVFSFSLLTAAFMKRGKKGCFIICISWLLIDTAFELGQKFHTIALTIIPDWFSGIPLLENTKNYFQYGTFDILDLTAIMLGGVAAYYTLTSTRVREKK